MSNPEIGIDPPDVLGAELIDRPTSALAVRAFRIYFVGTILGMNALRLGGHGPGA